MNFKLGDKEYPVVMPKGKRGRRATNFVLARLGASNVDVNVIVNLLNDEEFEAQHLPVLLGVDQTVLETEGTTMEIIEALLKIMALMFQTMSTPEVETALKNSDVTADMGAMI